MGKLFNSPQPGQPPAPPKMPVAYDPELLAAQKRRDEQARQRKSGGAGATVLADAAFSGERQPPNPEKKIVGSSGVKLGA